VPNGGNSTETALETAAPLQPFGRGLRPHDRRGDCDPRDEALQPAGWMLQSSRVWWWQLVRRIVLGDVARNNNSVTMTYGGWRKSGNWSSSGLSHTRLRETFVDRLCTTMPRTPDPTA